MKKFVVGSNDADRRLDKFLFKVMPNAGSGVIYKSLRKKHIKVNGKRVTDGSVKITEGDVLELYINDDFFADEKKLPLWTGVNPNLNVVYEDNHIIIMDKPSGMLSQGEEDEESLEAHMRAYLYRKNEFDPLKENTFMPSLCHRIDRNTRGLVIGAKDGESLRILNEKIKMREIRKYYLCRTEGTPKPEKGEIKGWLKKDGKNRKMEFSKTEVKGGAFCHTIYEVIKDGKQPLIEVELLTGRTHQIRACFSAMGCPLTGDVKYGASRDGKMDFQHLISYRIKFDFKENNGVLDYLKGKEITINKGE